MKTFKILISGFILAGTFIAPGCNEPENGGPAKYRSVDISGAAMVLNYSRSTFDLGPISFEGQDTLGLMLLEGDLLFIMLPEFESQLVYRYDAADGASLDFSYDTIHRLWCLNEEIIALDLSTGSGAWAWMNEHDAEAFRNIHSIQVELPLLAEDRAALERFAGSNPAAGLYISGNGPPEDVLAMFAPAWLFVEDLKLECVAGESDLKPGSTELLVYSCMDSGSLDFLLCFGELESLILSDCSANALAAFPFDQLPGLRSLSLFGCDIRDLSFIEHIGELQYLDLIECERLEDISSLEVLPGLRGVGFNECTGIKNPVILSGLPGLVRLGLPGGTGQADFEAIVRSRPGLEVLDLVDCEEITDLAVLTELASLRALTVNTLALALEPLKDMKQLEVLVLDEEYFEDSLQIAALRDSLPGTRIIPGGTFCLGSGWLLLIFPLLALWALFRNRKPTRERSVD